MSNRWYMVFRPYHKYILWYNNSTQCGSDNLLRHIRASFLLHFLFCLYYQVFPFLLFLAFCAFFSIVSLLLFCFCCKFALCMYTLTFYKHWLTQLRNTFRHFLLIISCYEYSIVDGATLDVTFNDFTVHSLVGTIKIFHSSFFFSSVFYFTLHF